MARITHDPKAPQMSWWDPVFTLADLEKEWSHGLNTWLKFLETKNKNELFEEMKIEVIMRIN